MKKEFVKILSVLLSVLIISSFLNGCVSSTQKTESKESSETSATETVETNVNTTKAQNEEELVNSFDKLSDPRLTAYMQSKIYDSVLEKIDSSKYAIENIETIYVSKEYLEESAYNDRANIYFGYTLAELDQQFQGQKYVFTLGDDGKTAVKPFSPYDDTYDKMFLNIAIGTGVILVCVVLTVVTEGAGAPAAAAIFCASAKSGAIAAAASAVIGGTAAGITTGIETGDFDESLKAAALAGSEGVKWGAITGAISGGVGEAVALHGATASGLTMNEVAQIQRDSKYPLDVIKGLKNMEQYKILKEAGIYSKMVNGKTALIRDIDLKYLDEAGRSNLMRMQSGLAPLDSTGIPYELHHIGQKADSTLAVLTRAEHRLNGNSSIWHEIGAATDNPSSAAEWTTIRKQFWESMATILGG